MREKRTRTAFGERLHKARKHAALTQPQLASAAGLAQSTLAELEYDGNGSSKTAQLAKACGVRVEWLSEGRGVMVDKPQHLSPEILEVAEAVAALPEEQRGMFLSAMRNLLGMPEPGQKKGLSGTTASENINAGQRAVKRMRAA